MIDIAVKELDARDLDAWDNADVNRARKALEAARAEAVEALRQARYFVRQADWLQERFPDAELRDVEGLVKLVDRATIEAHDWSLTPGRYVGVAPEEEDEDFDFEEALRAIHIDLKGLNEEAAELAARIARELRGVGGVTVQRAYTRPTWQKLRRGRSRHRPTRCERFCTDGPISVRSNGDVETSWLDLTSTSRPYSEAEVCAEPIVASRHVFASRSQRTLLDTAILATSMHVPHSVIGFTADPREC